ncbi:MAG: Spy0128 family protein, partial [Coriobacteriales bacterium]
GNSDSAAESSIDSLSTTWLTEDTTDNNNDSLLYLDPSDNSSQTVTAQVDFSLSGNQSYDAGAIRVKVPGHIFKTRSGSQCGNLVLPLAEAPSTRTDFNWSYIDDGDGGYYILTNTREMAADAQVSIQLAYENVVPSELVDNATTKDLSASIELVTDAEDTLTSTADPLTAQIDTQETVTSASMDDQTYKTMTADEIAAKGWTIPENMASTDGKYVVVTWRTYASHEGNTSYKMEYACSPSDGYRHFIVGNGSGTEHKSGWSEDGTTSNECVKVAYPRSQFEVGSTYTLSNDATWTCTETDDQSQSAQTASASMDFAYNAPRQANAGGHFYHETWGDGDSYSNELNKLKTGGSVEASYEQSMRGYVLPWTMKAGIASETADDPEDFGARNVTMNLSDGTLTYADSTSAQGSELTAGEDFTFTRLHLVKPTIYKAVKYDGSDLDSNKPVSYDNGQQVWTDGGSQACGGTYGVGYVVDDDYTHIPKFTVTAYDAAGYAISTKTVDWSDGVQTKDVGLPDVTAHYKVSVTFGKADGNGSYVAAIADALVFPKVTLEPTEKVLAVAQTALDNQTDPATCLTSADSMTATYKNGDVIYSKDGTDSDCLRGCNEDISVLPSNTVSTSIDYANQVTKLTFAAKVEERSNIASADAWQTAAAKGDIASDKTCTWYDLLPKGVVPDLSSIALRDGDAMTDVYTVPDYKDSGRTLLVVKAELAPAPVAYGNDGGTNCYEDMPTITFDAIYSFESARSYGSDIHNVVAYESGNKSLGTAKSCSGEPDSPAAKAHNNAVTGLDSTFANDESGKAEKRAMTNLDPNADDPNFVYAGATTTEPLPTATTENAESGQPTAEARDVSCTMEWNDADDQDGKRPSSVTVHLYRNGADTGKKLTLDGTVDAEPAAAGTGCESASWAATFKGVPSCDKQGNAYCYSIVEDVPGGYAQSVKISPEGAETLVNTHTPETASVSGTKTWVSDSADVRPGSVTITLYQDGKSCSTKTVTADEKGNWSYSFDGLPRYHDQGTKYTYTVGETVEDYTTKIDTSTSRTSGDVTANITDTYHPYGSLAISEEVKNAPEQCAGKEFSFNVKLANADGSDFAEKVSYVTRTASGAKASTGTFANGQTLKIKADQTLTLKDIPEGVTYTVSGSAEEGYTASSNALSGTIASNATSRADFTSTYSSKGSISLSASKELVGADLAANQFHFELRDEGEKDADGNEVSAATDELLRTSANGEDGTATFGALFYDTADAGHTFTYKIVETDGKADGYADSDNVRYAQVTPKDNGDGTMTCTAKYYSDKACETETQSNECVFASSYGAEDSASLAADASSASCSVSIKGEEKLEGLDGASSASYEAGDSQFALYNVDAQGTTTGSPVQIVSNGSPNADTASCDFGVSTFEFSPITYTLEDMGDATDNGDGTRSKNFTYAVQEVIPDGAAFDEGRGAYTYDGIQYEKDNPQIVTVTVTDNGSGELTASVSDETQLSFTNSIEYGTAWMTTTADTTSPAKPDQEFPFKVSLSAAGEYEYQIYAGSSDDSAETESGSISNGGTVSLENGETLYIRNLPAGSTYSFEEQAPSGWTKASSSNMSGTVAADESDSANDTGVFGIKAIAAFFTGADSTEPTTPKATLTNDYAASGSAIITTRKVLEGAMLADKQFAFELVDSPDASAESSGNVVSRVTNDASGNVDFGKVSYSLDDLSGSDGTNEKTFTYTIREAHAGSTQDGVKYDDTMYKAKVTVADQGDGTLSTSVAYRNADDTADVAASARIIKNTTMPTVTLRATKSLVNKDGSTHSDWDGRTFAFNVTPQDGAPMLVNNGRESVASLTSTDASETCPTAEFERLYYSPDDLMNEYGEFETKNFKYQISEVIPDDATTTVGTETKKYSDLKGSDGFNAADYTWTLDGVTYDATPQTATVTVSSTLDSGFEANISYDKGTSSKGCEFTNTYDATGNVTLSAIKQLSGRDWTDDDAFELTLTAEDGAPLRTADGEKGSITAVATKDDRAPAFDDLVFEYSDLADTDAEGNITGHSAKTFTYNIHEEHPSGAVQDEDGNWAYKGITYADDQAVTVNVSDNGDGTLEVTYGAPQIGAVYVPSFQNTYSAKSTSAQILVSKGVSGRSTWNDDETYTFQLTAGSNDADTTTPMPDSSTVTVSDDSTATVALADGTEKTLEHGATFGDITYKKAGTYLYTVTEVIPDDATTTVDGNTRTYGELSGETSFDASAHVWTKDGVTYDGSTHAATVTVTDDGSGQLHSSVSYDGESDSESAAFTNTYEADGTAQVSATKTLTGSDLEEGEFSFELHEGSDATGTLLQSASNAADGTVAFAPLAYSLEDLDGATSKTFDYAITEVMPTDDQDAEGVQSNGITYDGTTHTAHVTVSDAGDGSLSTTVTYDDGSETPPVFANTYSATPAKVNLSAHKTLEGAELADEQFNFELKGSDGSSTVLTNDADGTITLPEWSYDEPGTWTYTLSERDDGEEGYTYDTTSYKITVTVADNGKGALNSSVSVSNGSEEVGVDGISFKNVYKSSPEKTDKTKPSGDVSSGTSGDVSDDTSGATPQTGDLIANIVILLVVVMVCAGVVICLVHRRRKNDRS